MKKIMALALAAAMGITLNWWKSPVTRKWYGQSTTGRTLDLQPQCRFCQNKVCQKSLDY